jgi:hypothetical protein
MTYIYKLLNRVIRKPQVPEQLPLKTSIGYLDKAAAERYLEEPGTARAYVPGQPKRSMIA